MTARATGILLGILVVLFIGRVVGQLLVVIYAPSFLPPMEEWYSGLMPYRFLLPAQIIIVILFSRIAWNLVRGVGFWAEPRQQLGRWLRNAGVVYLAAMLLRYIFRMSWYPEERWFGGTIPIFFHWVLAIYIIVLGLYLLEQSKQTGIKNKEQETL